MTAALLQENARLRAELAAEHAEYERAEEMRVAYKAKWISTMQWLGMDQGDLDVKRAIDKLREDLAKVTTLPSKWEAMAQWSSVEGEREALTTCARDLREALAPSLPKEDPTV